MTTSSTVLALGTMPLWLYVLPKLARIDDKLMVPFDELGECGRALFKNRVLHRQL